MIEGANVLASYFITQLEGFYRLLDKNKNLEFFAQHNAECVSLSENSGEEFSHYSIHIITDSNTRKDKLYTSLLSYNPFRRKEVKEQDSSSMQRANNQNDILPLPITSRQ